MPDLDRGRVGILAAIWRDDIHLPGLNRWLQKSMHERYYLGCILDGFSTLVFSH